MKIYVAAKFEEKDIVRELYEWLREDGHEITHDWTDEDDAGKSGPALLDYYVKCAREDVDGVMTADVLVLLPHDRGKGLYVELGVALACGIPVVIWEYDGEKHDCIFLQHPDIGGPPVKTQAEILARLRQVEAEERAA